MQTFNELQTYQRYFRLVNKGLVEDPFTCVCGYELAFVPKRVLGDYHPFFVCYMCLRQFKPGSEHKRIAAPVIQKIEKELSDEDS